MINNEFVSWQYLKSKELSNYYQNVVTEWNNLLNNKSLKEPAYLKYLQEYAGFFFHDSMKCLVSISEFEFGADLRADFVLCRDRASYGFEYEFIEIESPHDPVYTKKGVPSSHLSEALAQIQSWRLWLDANRPEAKRMFPSKSFIYSDQPAFKFTIIIGSRNTTKEYTHLRNHLGLQMNIEIRSFDYLSEILQQRSFANTPIICSSEFSRLSFAVKNSLANPYSSAFKSATWRKMVKSPSFSSSHMIADNADIILSERIYAKECESYISSWLALPAEIREAELDRTKVWSC